MEGNRPIIDGETPVATNDERFNTEGDHHNREGKDRRQPVEKQPEKAGFAAEKFAFLERVATDAKLTSAATRIAVIFASRYMRTGGGGCACPSIPTLEKILHLDKKTIRGALHAMVDRGHLQTESQTGKPTSYHIATPTEKREGFDNRPLPNNSETPTEKREGHPSQKFPRPLPKTGSQKPYIKLDKVKPYIKRAGDRADGTHPERGGCLHARVPGA